jgi:hypothetical protein
MFGHVYYHETIRKMTALVGTLFNDIIIQRKETGGAVRQNVRVPIVYGPRDKYLARHEAQPELKTTVAITLPMISFELTGVEYDSNRKLSTTGRIYSKSTDNGSLSKVYNPVPYDLTYNVNIYSNNMEDGSKILEQILPFFTPAWSATVKLLGETHPNINTDVYIELEGVKPDDVYEGDFEKRRAFVWVLSIRVHTYFFGPTNTAKIVKFAETTTYAGDLEDSARHRKTIWEPKINGEAHGITSPLLIDEDDDWGYHVTIEDS